MNTSSDSFANVRFPLALIFAMLATSANADDTRPNLLLITADDLGVQLGCYGDPQARTPHLDQFAQSAVLFEVAHVAQASCSPSRSAMLTGLYPHRNGQYGLANALRELPLDQRFNLLPEIRPRVLPRLLKDSGYRTACIGKLHVNPESAFPFDQRFSAGFGSRDVRQQANQLSQTISASDDRPWFVMANVFDPHVKVDRKNGRAKSPGYFPDQVMGLPKHPREASEFEPFPFQGVSDASMMKRVAGYYNCVERADAAIGLFLSVLEASGQADKTVVIILGDHGPPVGRGKTTCYEAGLRVPFLVRWPGVSEPHRSERLVSAVDIVPTFLDAAGLEAELAFHGDSLRPVLSLDDDAPWREYLFAEFQFHGAKPYYPRRSVRDTRYKLIHNPLSETAKPNQSVDSCPAPKLALRLPKSSPVHQIFSRLQSPPEWELYDLESDPWEWTNRADDPAMANVKDRLTEALTRWRQETEDPFLDPSFVKTVPGQ
ncbi:MAG: sulfatase [Planctomycetota bacterium]